MDIRPHPVPAAPPPTRIFVRRALHIALAHHPLCGTFDSDVYRIGPLRFCRGCVLTWPSFLVGIAGGGALLHVGSSPLVLFATGLLLGVPHLGTYLRRRGSLARAAAKLLGGLGLGAVLVGLVALPVPAWMKVTFVVALGTSFLFLQGLRARSMVRTCRDCPWQMDWERCPGFATAHPISVPLPPR